MIKETLIKLRNLFSEMKIYYSRANAYVALANSAMLLYITVSTLRLNIGFDLDIKKLVIPICIVFVLFVLFIGWLESYLGFFKQEAKRVADRNPYFQQTLDEVKKVNERLNKIESSLHKPNKAG